MNEHVQALAKQAHDALAAARYNLNGGFLSTAVNRAYYAAFHMARAVLLLKGETPRTHKGVQRRFLLHVVQAGLLEQEVAALLPRAARRREEADYDDGALIEADEAEALIRDVERFLAAVKPLLTDDPNP